MIFLENEAVFCYEQAVMSVVFDCRDYEYRENGIVLYGSEPNGLIRSHNTLVLSSEPCFRAMHDGTAEIKALNGSRITCRENGERYSVTCANGAHNLVFTLNGSCRLNDMMITFRRGSTEICFSEPTTATVTQKRRGLEYEAVRCLSLMSELTSDSELLPLLILVNGLKIAHFDRSRAEGIAKILPTMSEQNKKTAETVLKRYYRAFGEYRNGNWNDN